MYSGQTAISLLSSGLDSTVATGLALAAGIKLQLALTFDYGQRAAAQEESYAKRMAAFWGVEHRTISLPFFSLSHSELLQKTAPHHLPHPSMKDLDDPQVAQHSAQRVWVPNRNGVFIEVAAAIAEQLDANTLIVGFNREEATTFPDNSSDYRESLNRALSYSTSNQVTVISPTEHLDKTEILKKALELKIPLENLWSCYEHGKRMCGRCESCMRLKRAMKQNEVVFNALFEDTYL